jgi:biopolymer transport protein ExbD
MLVSIGGIMLVLCARSGRLAYRQTSAYSRLRAPDNEARAISAGPPAERTLFPAAVVCLLAASVLLLVVCPVWNTFFAALDRQGIWVLTSGRSRLTPRYGQGSKPLTLRIDKQRRWFFEGEPVSPEEFPAALRQALNRRPDPFVCLDADPGLDLAVPGQAMDMLQGMFVKIIIATPNAKDDGCTATIGR